MHPNPLIPNLITKSYIIFFTVVGLWNHENSTSNIFISLTGVNNSMVEVLPSSFLPPKI